MAEISQVDIPNRPLFKAAEVCELAKVQPYVLRSWEAEFKDLGVSKNGSATRVYRREDIERVLAARFGNSRRGKGNRYCPVDGEPNSARSYPR